MRTTPSPCTPRRAAVLTLSLSSSCCRPKCAARVVTADAALVLIPSVGQQTAWWLPAPFYSCDLSTPSMRLRHGFVGQALTGEAKSSEPLLPFVGVDCARTDVETVGLAPEPRYISASPDPVLCQRARGVDTEQLGLVTLLFVDEQLSALVAMTRRSAVEVDAMGDVP